MRISPKPFILLGFQSIYRLNKLQECSYHVQKPYDQDGSPGWPLAIDYVPQKV